MYDLKDIIEKPIPNPNCIVVETIRKMDFLKLDQTKGWVAGGSVMKLAMNETDIGESDIDVFIHLQTNDEFVSKKIADTFLGIRSFNPAYINHQIENNQVIQIITKWRYGSLFDVFNDFDFTCSMFSTDGYKIKAPRQAWEDLDNRILRLHHPKVDRKTINRIPKYMTRGFDLLPGVLTSIVKRAADDEFDLSTMTFVRKNDNY